MQEASQTTFWKEKLDEWMWYKFQKPMVQRYRLRPNSDLIFVHAAIQVKKRNGRSQSHAEYIAVYTSTKPE